MKGLIHCDTCHHEQHEDDIASWHGKDCPKCGAPEIINDEDYMLCLLMEGMVSAGLITQGETDKPSITVHVDTAGLRK